MNGVIKKEEKVMEDFFIGSPIQFLPKQLDAMRAIKEYSFTVYSGAVAAGKTLLLAHAAIRTCINNPYSKGIIGSLTYTQLSNVVFTVFKEELGKYQDLLNKNNVPINLIKNISESYGKMKIEFFNGSIIYFLAMDKEEKLRGYTIDFFCLDEPIEIDEKVFDQLIARLRGKNLKHTYALLTTNPGAETHWIYQKFYTKHRDRGKYYHIDTNSYENVFLPKGYIENMEATYDEDWKRRFLDGNWGAFEGQIYKNFSEKKHVVDGRKYESQFKYYIAGVDFGIRNPTCILTIGVTKDKTAVVVDEYYKNEETSTKIARKIKELDKKYSYRKIFIDPSALDLITQCKELHLPAEKADNHVEPGIAKVKSMFQREQVLIDRHCRNLIRELQAYRYIKDKNNQNSPEKPMKIDDHAPDALRYGVYSFKIFKRKQLWDFIPSPCEDY
jgi:PBSX family phage terminase large subunit